MLSLLAMEGPICRKLVVLSVGATGANELEVAPAT